MSYWLMKSEPSCFSIDDLKSCSGGTDSWDGVRNYQARNFLRDTIKVGDGVLFYHSNCPEPAIVGLAKVVRAGYPDHTALDPREKHFDPKASQANPIWYMVDVQLRRTLPRVVTLRELRQYSDGKLKGFRLLARGNRLSVMPVSEAHWNFIESLSAGK